MSRRKYNIIIGSRTFFESKLPKMTGYEYEIESFLELVKRNDNCSKNGYVFDEYAENLILKNNNYHGIVESAHDRLGPLIEDLTTDEATIYLHNPPSLLREFIEEQSKRGLVDYDVVCEKYTITRNPKEFVTKIKEISSNILGQDSAIREISKSLWYLTNVERKKPYVIMLYGNSSLGKTELIREISKHFFGNKCLEKHLSMFKNNNYSDYFFGNLPNRRSLGFDLLERESNLIFFDEIDKCPEHFYSAFYTLFDNIIFKDLTYDVDISGIVIMLTSNFHTLDEIKKYLGFPIFYRIDKFVNFKDFDIETTHSLVRNEIEKRSSEFIGRLSSEEVYQKVSKTISVTGENARTIKYKIQQVIEEMLFSQVDDK